jgi:DNA-binding NtrC family response regulator
VSGILPAVSHLRVLVIDDDPLICAYLIDLLTPEQIDVTAINQPRVALEHLRSGTSYHLLILDLTMPGMTGLELLEQLREFDQQIAVILISAYPCADTGADPAVLDASAFIQKPFSNAEMRETIARVVRTRGIDVER